MKNKGYAMNGRLVNGSFIKAYKQYNANLNIAIAIRALRRNMHLNQQAFARLVGKSQSTIAKIENGSMKVSNKLLAELNNMLRGRLRPVE